MGRPGSGITDSAVEAQAQAMICPPQRVNCPRRERAVRHRRLPPRESWALSVPPATAPDSARRLPTAQEMPQATTSAQYPGLDSWGQARPGVIDRADGRAPRPARPNGLYRALAGFAYRASRPWRATPPVWVAVQDPHDGDRAEAADLLNACAQPGYSGFIHPVIAAAAAAIRR
jgi:hypothetical protein